MKLYRMMKEDHGKPLAGDGSMMLGVRPTDPALPHKRADVPAAVAGTDVVRPGDGGLSCFSDPAAIKIQSAKLKLWSIEEDDLPAGLNARVAGDPHYHIEPNRDMTLDDLQRLLEDTQHLWVRE